MARDGKDKISVLSAIIFALTFITFGFPLWWKTTETYKVPLPYNDISSLPLHKIVHLIPVTIVLADRTVHQSTLWEQLLLLSEQEYEMDDAYRLEFQYSWKMRPVNKDEENVIVSSTNMYDLDRVLNNNNVTVETGAIHIIVLGENFGISPSAFIIGCHRYSYIMNNFDNAPSSELAENIISLVKVLVQSATLQHYYHPLPHLKMKPEKERMRSLSTTVVFDIIFSVIVSEPLKNDIHWDIETAVNEYISPYLKQLSMISDVDVKSQILYMSSLSMYSTFDSEKKCHVISEENLPPIINPIEAKLGNSASTNPALNFVIYIAPDEQSPLCLSDTSGFLISSNAFLSPQWGGFLIYNLPDRKSNENLPSRINLDINKIMEVFLGHLKLLLGLPNMVALENFHVLQDPVLSDWEVDFLLRKNCHEQLLSAISSLHSLGHLLQTIGNIVIKDDVGEKIYSSVLFVKKSITFLQQGALKEAFLHAKQAFINSEAAFFDPSLLALLYFPDDQKYAIYIPLFLPVSIPVIMSLQYIWKHYKAIEKNDKKD